MSCRTGWRTGIPKITKPRAHFEPPYQSYRRCTPSVAMVQNCAFGERRRRSAASASHPWQAFPSQARDFLHHLLRNRADASRTIGRHGRKPAASNERLASLRWLARPSSKFSKPDRVAEADEVRAYIAREQHLSRTP